MAKNNSTPKIERPCANPACGHVHEGIPCMEDGCECKKSVPAAVPAPAPQVDARTDSEVEADIDAFAQKTFDAIEEARSKMTDEEREEADRKADAILTNTGLRNTLPLQERIANLIEDFEAENGQIPVGCELVICGRVYAWNGERMIESQEPVPEPPPLTTAVLSEDDQAKLREFFAEQSEIKELPDGSVMLPLRIDVDQLEILKAWAEGAGEHWVTFAQRTLEMGLNAVINGGAVAG